MLPKRGDNGTPGDFDFHNRWNAFKSSFIPTYFMNLAMEAKANQRFDHARYGLKVCFLKLPSLFAARLFLTFHNKLLNMKALVILSHHDHHFSHLLVFMKRKRTFVGPYELFWSIFVRKTPHSSPCQHRGSYRYLCTKFLGIPCCTSLV